MAGKPNLNSPSAQKELDKVEEQFQAQEQEIKNINLDRVVMSPNVPFSGASIIKKAKGLSIVAVATSSISIGWSIVVVTSVVCPKPIFSMKNLLGW